MNSSLNQEEILPHEISFSTIYLLTCQKCASGAKEFPPRCSIYIRISAGNNAVALFSDSRQDEFFHAQFFAHKASSKDVSCRRSKQTAPRAAKIFFCSLHLRLVLGSHLLPTMRRRQGEPRLKAREPPPTEIARATAGSRLESPALTRESLRVFARSPHRTCSGGRKRENSPSAAAVAESTAPFRPRRTHRHAGE